MRITFLIAVLLFTSCKQTVKNQNVEKEKAVEKVVESKKYPETITKVFQAHGGLDSWNSYKTMEFKFPVKEFEETHTIGLYSRKDKVEATNYSYGFDGENVWELDKEDAFKGDAFFYHNLYFYFGAMPFVLADSGIVYSDTEALEYDGVSYPGIKISYNDGVGTSPKDNYYLHYNPETYNMEWLGYTFTYNTGKVSDNVKWIRYNDWTKVNEFLLPKSITWFDYEGRKIKEPKNTIYFKDAQLHKHNMPNNFYAIPEGGNIVTRK